jgi:hypothetical protein
MPFASTVDRLRIVIDGRMFDRLSEFALIRRFTAASVNVDARRRKSGKRIEGACPCKALDDISRQPKATPNLRPAVENRPFISMKPIARTE